VEPAINFEKKKNNLMLVSKMAIEDLQEISGDKAEIICIVFNEENTIVGYKRENIDFSELPPNEFQHMSVMTIPPGAYKCRVVIRNLDTGKGAIGLSSVYIPKVIN
jgi:hypothetical protein